MSNDTQAPNVNIGEQNVPENLAEQSGLPNMSSTKVFKVETDMLVLGDVYADNFIGRGAAGGTYATQVGFNPEDPLDTASVVLDAGTDGTDSLLTVKTIITDGTVDFTGATLIGIPDLVGISLTDLSVSVGAAGVANLEYDNTTGVFTYTPPSLDGYLPLSGGTLTAPLYFEDGGITVGGIGTNGGRLSIGSGDVNLNFDAPANSIYPISDTVGTLSDGIVDIGASNARFKDLYLAGTATMDGLTVDGRDVATDISKLDGIEAGATADQTAVEIKTAYESNADTNAFTDADESKLDGIEASADVTDTTNVTAAGALMDSELTSIASVKALNQGVATTDSPTFAGLTTSADVSFGDNGKAIFGAGSDLQIYHDGSNSYIDEVGQGTLYVRADSATSIVNPSNTLSARFRPSTSVSLYYNGAEKLATTSTGIEVTGTATMGGLTMASGSQSVIGVFGTSGLQMIGQTDAESIIGTMGANEPLVLRTGSAERLRIDSSGNLLVGTTSTIPFTFSSGTGAGITSSGTIMGAAAAEAGLFNRVGSDGSILSFFKSGTTVGSIGVLNANNLTVGGTVASHAGIQFGTENVTPMVAGVEADGGANLGATNLRWRDLYLSGNVNLTGGKISSYAADASAPYFADGGNVGIRLSQAGVDDIVPCSSTGADRDNVINFGAAGARWGTIFAATGAINTSDQNEKQDIAELSEAEQRVAVAAKGLLRKFRWKDSVAEKGDAARTHVGIMAQDLQAAFAAEGLNASDYAMWCSDTWTDKETGEEKTRMGVRYSELLAFIIAAL